MKVIVAGGTGFLGRPLVEALAANQHDVVVLTRGGAAAPAGARAVQWDPNGGTGRWAAELDGASAVVNLAGESIAARRWSAEHKRRILDSRINATHSLVGAIDAAASRPAVFISGSAVGYYGPLGDEIVTETTPAGSDFLARVCAQWEAEANR